MRKTKATAETTRNLCVQVPAELLDQAHEVAKDRDLSVSQLVRALLRDAYTARFGLSARRSL